MPYMVKTRWWLSQLIYRRLIWKMPPEDKPSVYLTFDDGPHISITPFVLEQLARYNAKATFFCIGKNIIAHPEVYKQTLAAGHSVGNHTFNHLNGWHTKTEPYINNIKLAAGYIRGRLFRPPYGRIKRSQVNRLSIPGKEWNIYMWDVLSGDFDTNLSPEKCLKNVLSNIEPGSIVVFHDSEKAWDRMSYALPHVLEYCKKQNWQLKALPNN